MQNSKFKIVLFAPEIPGNTGSIGRTCVALNLELYLIKPYGFEIDEKAVRRAGLDYWKHVQLKEFESWEDFLIREKPQREKLFFFEKNCEKLY
jgi:tRNA (cytidine/uridine-2'-O-)-methyltransferase